MIVIVLLSLILNPVLTVSVTGIERTKGQIVVAVYNSEENFLNEAKLFTYKIIKVKQEGELTFTLNLPQGKYAISLYHDINADKKLNTNLVGAPKEPYGFSNNARGLFSAPEYAEAMILVNGDVDVNVHLE